jgi:hypothetical protein
MKTTRERYPESSLDISVTRDDSEGPVKGFNEGLDLFKK